MSSITIGNALRATCHYQQEALDKSIGACTNNRAVSIYATNGEDIAKAKILLTRLYFFITIKVYFMLNSKIDIINRNILMLLYLMHAVIEVSRLDSM